MNRAANRFNDEAHTIKYPRPEFRLVDFPALLQSLRRWGVLRSARVERALEEIPWEAVLPVAPGRHGYLYAPIPHAGDAFEFSPRLSVLLAELLELQDGLRVALPAPTPRLLALLVRGTGAVVQDPLRDKAADRAVELGSVARAAPLASDGFALHLRLDPHAESLVKRVHAGDARAELGLDNHPLLPDQVPPRPIRQLLVVEGFLRRALAARPQTRQDEQFANAVEGVWDPAAGRNPALPPEDRRRLQVARTWFHLAYVHQFAADLGDSMELYRASLDAFPTAEAHTFLGWTLSFAGNVGRAILECEAAIAVDPTLGNPYNDIGAYLLELGQPNRALPWFERALIAPRYEAPHFAHCNRGRALLRIGRAAEARAAFEKALELEPSYKPAREYLKRASQA